MHDGETAGAPRLKPPPADRLIDATFLLTMPLMAWLAVFGHRGAVIVAALPAMAIALRPRIWREGLSLLLPSRVAREPLPRAAAAGLFFVLWIAVTGFWSPTPGAWKLALAVCVFTICGGALVYEASRASERRAVLVAGLFASSVMVAAALLAVEGVTGGVLRDLVPPTDQSLLRWKDMTALARGVTFIAPLAFPAAAIMRTMALRRRPADPIFAAVAAATPVVAAFAAAMQFSVTTNVVAILAGIGAGAVALWRPKHTLIALGALFVVSLLSAPLFAFAPAEAVLQAEPAVLPPSWAQRVNLWKEAADRVLEGCFWAGCGADYTRAWAADSRMIDVPGSPIPLKEAPLHPHNIFLQIWLELGAFGVLTIAAALWFGLQRLVEIPPRRAAFAAIAGAAAASYISFMFEASLWQSWRIAVLSLAVFGGALSYSLNGSRRN